MDHETGTPVERRSAQREQYNWCYGAGVSQRHARRRARESVAFLLPHLRPGMSLLDCGSGVGSITIDLAEAVAPGEPDW